MVHNNVNESLKPQVLKQAGLGGFAGPAGAGGVDNSSPPLRHLGPGLSISLCEYSQTRAKLSRVQCLAVRVVHLEVGHKEGDGERDDDDPRQGAERSNHHSRTSFRNLRVQSYWIVP